LKNLIKHKINMNILIFLTHLAIATYFLWHSFEPGKNLFPIVLFLITFIFFSRTILPTLGLTETYTSIVAAFLMIAYVFLVLKIKWRLIKTKA